MLQLRYLTSRQFSWQARPIDTNRNFDSEWRQCATCERWYKVVTGHLHGGHYLMAHPDAPSSGVFDSKCFMSFDFIRKGYLGSYSRDKFRGGLGAC